jgi:hypothetical protein
VTLPVDVVYVAAAAHDARFTRICVASLRTYYPDAPIKLLAGGVLEDGLTDELAAYWDVALADLPRLDYGWGFVKLEPLFGPPGERFLVLDSDTVITGPVLDYWGPDAGPFLVDDESQPQGRAKEIYYDWDALRGALPAVVKPRFLFNSGQWFGTSSVLTRRDFEPVLAWTTPPTLPHAQWFMPGDQGVLNFVLNQKAALEGLRVERKVIMRWPRNDMSDLSADAVVSGRAPARVVHWAGLKQANQRLMPASDLLRHFETTYYRRLPRGAARRSFRALRSTSASLAGRLRAASSRLRLTPG